MRRKGVSSPSSKFARAVIFFSVAYLDAVSLTSGRDDGVVGGVPVGG